MGRATWRPSHALRDPRVIRRHDIRSAGRDDVRVEKRLHEIGEPVRIDADIGIGVGDDGACRGREADVARDAQAVVRRRNQSNERIAPRDRLRCIFRSIVDDDDFVVGVSQLVERRQTVVECVRGVVRADDDRDLGPRPLLGGRERRLAERLRHGRGGRFRAAIVIDHSERPVVDVVPATPPFVGPRERNGAARALGKRGANLHGGQLGLSVVPFTNAVGAGLGDEQRQITGHMLKPRQVFPEVQLVVQVDVERADIEKGQLEIFGGRKVHVGEQAVRRKGLAFVIQLAQESFDPRLSVPSHDRRGNLVAQGEHQHRGMMAKLPHSLSDVLANAAGGLRLIQKRDVLRPWNANHEAQAGAGRLVEDRLIGDGIGANRVDAVAPHQCEIGAHLLQGRELLILGIGRKRPVRHSLRNELLPACNQKLPRTLNPLCQHIQAITQPRWQQLARRF